MASCTITLKDGLDGGVEVGARFEPPLAPGNNDGVYALGRRVLDILSNGIEDEVTVYASEEPEA